MTSRERVLTALTLGQPDRVPWIEGGADSEMQVQVMGREDFRQAELAAKLRLDAIKVDYLPPLFVQRKKTTAREFIEDPLLTSPEALSLMEFPDASDAGFYDEGKRIVDENRNDYAVIGKVRLGASATLMSMGLQAFSFALMDYPGLVEDILDRFCDWTIEVVRHLPDVGVDAVWAFDDVAYKTGPMFAPSVFREVFLPRLKRVTDAIRSTGLLYIQHSDGNLMPIMDDWLELGMDAIHPIEPGPMDINEVKRLYGDRVCLIGNIDLHYTLTMGTPAEVEEEVRQRIEKVGRGGGYIISSANSITSYCKVENVLAMRDAIEKYGYYESDS